MCRPVLFCHHLTPAADPSLVLLLGVFTYRPHWRMQCAKCHTPMTDIRRKPEVDKETTSDRSRCKAADGPKRQEKWLLHRSGLGGQNPVKTD